MPTATSPSIERLLGQYLRYYPKETFVLDRLTRFAAETAPAEELIARTNFAGHVTASGFVLSADRSAVLLVHHRGLDMYLQPGGHVDPDDVSLLERARREIREETGVTALRHLATFADADVGISEMSWVPFDIDSHYIPPNAKKGEPEHWHHDFRYLFVCEESEGSPLTLATEEVAGAKWVPVERLGEYPTLERAGEKVQRWRGGRIS